MRIYEQVDNNAQDLEATNRQLRNQLSVEQQVGRITREGGVTNLVLDFSIFQGCCLEVKTMHSLIELEYTLTPLFIIQLVCSWLSLILLASMYNCIEKYHFSPYFMRYRDY